MYKTWAIFQTELFYYSNMALRGNLEKTGFKWPVLFISTTKSVWRDRSRSRAGRLQRLHRKCESPQPANKHTFTNTHMHTEYKMANPYSMENNTSHRKLRLQMSSAKPEASACNHSILTLRHQSALQQYKPIINPQDVPTLKSFPSRPEADQSEATFSHLVRIHFSFPVTAGRIRMTNRRATWVFSTCRIKKIPSQGRNHCKPRVTSLQKLQREGGKTSQGAEIWFYSLWRR